MCTNERAMPDRPGGLARTPALFSHPLSRFTRFEYCHTRLFEIAHSCFIYRLAYHKNNLRTIQHPTLDKVLGWYNEKSLLVNE